MQSGKLLTRIDAHSTRVGQLKFASTGNFLISISSSDAARWNVSSWKESRRFEFSSSPTLALPYLITEKVLWDVESVALLPAHEVVYVDVALGAYLKKNIKGRTSELVRPESSFESRWAFRNQQCIGPISMDTNSILGVSIDDSILARSDSNGDLVFLKHSPIVLGKGYATLTPVHAAIRPELPIRQLEFSSKLRVAITGHSNGDAKVWSLDTGDLIATLPGHAGDVTSIVITDDGRRIVTGGADGIVRIWEGLNSGPTHRVGTVAVASDRQFLAITTTAGEIQIVDVNNSNAARTIAATGTAAAISAGGRLLAVLETPDLVGVWDVESAKRIREIKVDGARLSQLSFSPDDSCIAMTSPDGTLVSWNLRTRKILRRDNLAGISSLCFSPDGTQIAMGCYDAAVRIVDAHTLKEIAKPLEGHTGPVTCIAFAAEATRLVSGSFVNELFVWDLESREQPVKCVGHSATVLSVDISRNSDEIVSAGADDTVRIWDADTGQLKVAINVRQRPSRVAFLGDAGREHFLVASEISPARVWRTDARSVDSPTIARPVIKSRDSYLRCRSCHASETMAWERSTHFAAHLKLNGAMSRKYAEALGLDDSRTDVRCVSCHGTPQRGPDQRTQVRCRWAANPATPKSWRTMIGCRFIRDSESTPFRRNLSPANIARNVFVRSRKPG
jgi:WD40 repeat protein